MKAQLVSKIVLLATQIAGKETPGMIADEVKSSTTNLLRQLRTAVDEAIGDGAPAADWTERAVRKISVRGTHAGYIVQLPADWCRGKITDASRIRMSISESHPRSLLLEIIEEDGHVV